MKARYCRYCKREIEHNNHLITLCYKCAKDIILSDFNIFYRLSATFSCFTSGRYHPVTNSTKYLYMTSETLERIRKDKKG